MPKSLDELIAASRTTKMTPQQQEQQRRSFAYGNTSIENPRITRDTVDQAARALDANVKRG